MAIFIFLHDLHDFRCATTYNNHICLMSG